MTESGVQDSAALPDDIALATQLASSAPAGSGLLAAMLLVPGWQWPAAPLLAQVPDDLWGDVTAWLFTAPQGFCEPGQAEKFAAHTLKRLEELVSWVQRNSGSGTVRSALDAYLRTANAIPLYFSEGSLRTHAELRGRLFARAIGSHRDTYVAVAEPRFGRRLRVGFVNRHFGSQTETYTTLPTFEQLDADRFEVVLFAHRLTDTPLEAYCRQRAQEFHLLPSDAAAQLNTLRDARLDVIVFGTNVTAVFNEVTRLALYRSAPLQVVNNSSCITSGLPHVDLYVSGQLTETVDAAEHFSERLALLPGPAHAFNYQADQEAPTTEWTRAALGLPDDAVVFVTAANYFKIIPEMQHAWARLIAQVPGSYLLVHPFNPNWSSSYPIQRFCAGFDQVLAQHGVDAGRLRVSTERFPSRSDVKALLSVGDIYLDTFPFGGVNSLVDPLELGIPTLTWEGATFRSRMGAALMRQLGLEPLITNSEADYLQTAQRLATDVAWRTELRQTIASRMERAPLFLDTLAASDTFGDLLETAYDALADQGADAFRALRSPILAHQPSPIDAIGRHARGVELLAVDRSARAADYLMSAVQQDEGNPTLWYDLAKAFRASKQIQPAIQSLEASLRLDATRPDSWIMLVELATGAGMADLAREALDCARELAPNDPRVLLATPPGELFAGGLGLPNDAFGLPKHILLYSDDPEFGGVAQWNHNILLALAKQGYRVTSVQSRCDNPLIKEQEAAGVRHQWLDYDTGKQFGRTLEDRSHAESLFRADRPDLVIFADCCPVSNLAARQTALDHGIPYLTVVHFVGEYLAKNFAAYLPALSRQHAAARAVVAVSENNLQLLRQHFGTPKDQGMVIHNGRPPRFFQPADPAVRQRLRAEQRISEQTVVCFTAARLTKIKGFAYQLEAMKLLKKKGALQNLCFVWAGDGDQRAALTQAVADLGLSDHVRFLGHRWDIADWYDAADLFLLPSELEGMPLSVMEAMAKGIPVIATAVSGTPEELGDTGKLLPNPLKDADGVIRQLAETIESWSQDHALRADQGRRGRERAERMFQESMMVDRTLALVASHLAPAEIRQAS
ncbi:MAG: glycosyltransferase [Opitutaceae bacterium]|nr:glycosyltransferase [Opitutaceae bacterium]